MVAAGGGTQGVSKGWRVSAVRVLPMNMLKLAVVLANIRQPLKKECVRRVLLFHWQRGAFRRVVLIASKHGALALSRDGNFRWLFARMYSLGCWWLCSSLV